MLFRVGPVSSRLPFSLVNSFPIATDVLDQKGALGNSLKGSWIKLYYIFPKDWYRLLEGFLRDCHPTLTYVNSKSLIITLAHPENR